MYLKRHVALILVISILSISLLGADNSDAFNFDAYNLKVVAERVDNGQFIFELEDKDNNLFTVITKDSITESQMKKIIELKDTFHSWKYLTIAQMTFVIFENEIEINMNPKTFEYKDVDFTKYISAGIGFFHGNVTEYRFRLTINNNYPRISGTLTTELEFCEAILAAVQGQSSDITLPSNGETDEYGSNNSSTVVSSDYKRIMEEINSLKETIFTIETELEMLKQENVVLRDDLEKLRRAILVLHNLGIFGNINIVKMKAIERIVSLKEENPDIMQEEAAEILRMENYDINMHEIFLVFSVYFNEFK